MRSTTDVTEQVWLDWYLGVPATVICTTYRLTPAGLRALLVREVASYEWWRRMEGLAVLHVVCARCGRLTGPQLGMRTAGQRPGTQPVPSGARPTGRRALCCLCALDDELGETVQ